MSVEVYLACGLAAIVLALVLALAWPRARVGWAQVNMGALSTAYAAVPLVTLTVCVGLAATLHHANVTRTHCGVPNFWPSLSAAIGNNAPEVYLWRLAVGLHNPMTLLDSAVMYSNLVRAGANALAARVLVVWKCACCFSLYLLTFVTSSEDHALHEAGFILWLVCGTITTLLFYVLWVRTVDWSDRVAAREVRGGAASGGRCFHHCVGQNSFAWWWLAGFNGLYLACIPLAAFLYWHHNAYCWPYVYSFFGITEYVIVVAYIFGCGLGHHVCFRSSAMVVTCHPDEMAMKRF